MANDLIIVLDNVRSAQNVGSFFRTSDVFKVKKICLCGITSTPPNKEIFKTALGATETVEWEYFNNTIACVNYLKIHDFKVYCVEQNPNSTLLHKFEPSNIQPSALVFGNEVEGVSQDVIALADACIEIPQFGNKRSLNVSVAGGIVIWDVFKKINPDLFL